MVQLCPLLVCISWTSTNLRQTHAIDSKSICQVYYYSMHHLTIISPTHNLCRMIRFVNCIMMLACICDILAIIDSSFREFASILRTIADCVFYSAMGCMAGQIHHEVNYRKAKGIEGDTVQPNAAYEPPVVKAEPIN